MPNPIDPPAGCRFHPRCPRARDRCGAEEPLLEAGVPGHKTACFFPLEKWPLTAAEMQGADIAPAPVVAEVVAQ